MSDNMKNLQAYLECSSESVTKSIPCSETEVHKEIGTNKMYKKNNQIEQKTLSKRLSDSLVIPEKISEEELFFTPFHEKIPSDSVTDACSKIRNFLQESQIDFHSPAANIFLGYCFKDSTSVTFKLEFVTVNQEKSDQLYIRCFRFEGDAGTLKQFFVRLVQNCGWVNESVEDEPLTTDETYEDPFADSDEEEEEELTDFRYLNLQNDETVVDSWIDAIKTESTQEIISILLLMCFNSHKESNLTVMAEFSSKLIEAVMHIMRKPDASFQEVYGCCYLLNRLHTKKNFLLKSADLQVIADCLVRWSIVGGQRHSWNNPVPVSNNIQLQCATLLQELVYNTKSNINMKKLQKVVDHASTTKDVTKVLCNVIQKLQAVKVQ